MPIPEVKPQAIASRLPISQVRFSRNTPAILMMAPSGSLSMNWLERWAGPSNSCRRAQLEQLSTAPPAECVTPTAFSSAAQGTAEQDSPAEEDGFEPSVPL